ncbi:MAG: hypothetical protein V3G42_10945 [Oscillospiraceae bacterium]
MVDNYTSITVTGRKEDVCGSIYTLEATYKGFTTTFELGFRANSMVTKNEKTVIFQTDEANMTYYVDDKQQNDVYTLIFIYHGDTVNKILHNGTSTNKTNSDAFPNYSIFTDKMEFDKWSYSINDGDTKYTADNATLLTAINEAVSNAVITVKPVLRDKTITPTP